MSSMFTQLFNRQTSAGRLQDSKRLGEIVYMLDEVPATNGDSGLTKKSGILVKGRIVKNTSGVSIPAGSNVKYAAAATDRYRNIIVAGAGNDVDGVLDPLGDALANGAVGVILEAGIARGVLASAATFAVGDLVKSGAAGVVVAAAAKTDAGYMGTVETATTTNSDPVDVILELTDSVNQYAL